jgi:hypothetical protein
MALAPIDLDSLPSPPSTMPIELSGSCHCGAVKFTVQSSTPVPYQVSVNTEDQLCGPTSAMILTPYSYASAPFVEKWEV